MAQMVAVAVDVLDLIAIWVQDMVLEMVKMVEVLVAMAKAVAVVDIDGIQVVVTQHTVVMDFKE